MPLDALAPDQRAVVQLVLQRGRSYAQIAEVLKISEDAVRARAHAGLTALAPGVELPADKVAQIADFLLGQQNGKPRQATRRLLRGDESARAWAEAVRDELADLGGALPDLPAATGGARAASSGEPPAADTAAPAEAAASGGEPPAADTAAPAEAAASGGAPSAASSEAAPKAAAMGAAAAAEDAAASDEPSPEADEGEANGAPATPAPRPRPLRDQAPRPRARPVAATDGGPGAAAAASSRLGGAVLIGLAVVAIVVVILALFVFRGDDKGNRAAATATPTAAASATPQAVGEIQLKGVNGSKGQGVMRLYTSQGQLAFTLEGTGVPQNRRNEAYAVWFTTPGGGSQRLGFAQPVGKNGQLGTTGPRTEDLAKFPQWLARYKQVVVSREHSGNAKKPGPIVLRGALPSA